MNSSDSISIQNSQIIVEIFYIFLLKVNNIQYMNGAPVQVRASPREIFEKSTKLVVQSSSSQRTICVRDENQPNPTIANGKLRHSAAQTINGKLQEHIRSISPYTAH